MYQYIKNAGGGVCTDLKQIDWTKAKPPSEKGGDMVW